MSESPAAPDDTLPAQDGFPRFSADGPGPGPWTRPSQSDGPEDQTMNDVNNNNQISSLPFNFDTTAVSGMDRMVGQQSAEYGGNEPTTSTQPPHQGFITDITGPAQLPGEQVSPFSQLVLGANQQYYFGQFGQFGPNISPSLAGSFNLLMQENPGYPVNPLPQPSIQQQVGSGESLDASLPLWNKNGWGSYPANPPLQQFQVPRLLQNQEYQAVNNAGPFVDPSYSTYSSYMSSNMGLDGAGGQPSGVSTRIAGSASSLVTNSAEFANILAPVAAGPEVASTRAQDVDMNILFVDPSNLLEWPSPADQHSDLDIVGPTAINMSALEINPVPDFPSLNPIPDFPSLNPMNHVHSPKTSPGQQQYMAPQTPTDLSSPWTFNSPHRPLSASSPWFTSEDDEASSRTISPGQLQLRPSPESVPWTESPLQAVLQPSTSDDEDRRLEEQLRRALEPGMYLAGQPGGQNQRRNDRAAPITAEDRERTPSFSSETPSSSPPSSQARKRKASTQEEQHEGNSSNGNNNNRSRIREPPNRRGSAGTFATAAAAAATTGTTGMHGPGATPSSSYRAPGSISSLQPSSSTRAREPRNPRQLPAEAPPGGQQHQQRATLGPLAFMYAAAAAENRQAPAVQRVRGSQQPRQQQQQQQQPQRQRQRQQQIRRRAASASSASSPPGPSVVTRFQALRPGPPPPLPPAMPPLPSKPSSGEKAAFLLEGRRRGLSYAEIRRLGGLKESESTLRGRHRTLVKERDQRVRKPVWHPQDDELLREAVPALTSPVGIEKGKVSWKSVAEYIRDHGGSYHFGNTACRKRWDWLNSVPGGDAAADGEDAPDGGGDGGGDDADGEGEDV